MRETMSNEKNEDFDINDILGLTEELEVTLTEEQRAALDTLIEKTVQYGAWNGIISYIDAIQDNIINAVLENKDPITSSEIIKETLERDKDKAETNRALSSSTVDIATVDLTLSFTQKRNLDK